MQERIEALQSHLNDDEAIIILSNANRLYFTGFQSSAGILLVTKYKADFLIDFRYYEKAKETICHCNVILAENLYQQIAEIFTDSEVKIIYTETSQISLSRYHDFVTALPDFEFSTDSKIDDLIIQQRSIKKADELRYIKQAQQITDDTFKYILERIKPGKTEREIMLDMEFYLRKQGSQGVAFDFIVVSGKNSSLPHGVPTDKVIEIGDFITMDFGAVVNGYCSDMTRTVAVGTVSDEQRHVYNTVMQAQMKAFEMIRPNVECIEVDRIARNYIYEQGYEGCFGHGLGHSIGIEVHESPCFNTRDYTPLAPGMVLSVEPGIYLPERFGVRIEDLVYITADGFDNLTASPKELFIL